MKNIQPISREAQALLLLYAFTRPSRLNAFTRPFRLPDSFLERWWERVLAVVAVGFVAALLVDIAIRGL
jgi:hypothetical protein